MVTIRYGDDGLSERLQSLAKQLDRPTALAAVVGRKARNILKTHFLKRDKSHANPLSERRTHFWRAASDSIHAPVVSADGGSVTISVTHTGVAQRYFGGTIRAKRVDFLTIPVSEEAYGRTVKTFEKEVGEKPKLLIIGRIGKSKNPKPKRDNDGFDYILTSSVVQKSDRTVLPTEEEFSKGILQTAESFVDRQVARKNAQ